MNVEQRLRLASVSSVASALLVPLLLSACGDDERVIDDADSGDGDAGADTDTDADSDADSDIECGAAWGWYDGATGLCWENPPSAFELTWEEAAPHCDALSLGGYDDWRLPLIQELISLIRGCVDGVATGDMSPSGCGAADPDCLGDSCFDSSCYPCDSGAGPGEFPACYWDPALLGECCTYWSSSTSADDADDAWYVFFEEGTANYGVKSFEDGDVRCVRGGA